jgi:hypothetical protein
VLRPGGGGEEGVCVSVCVCACVLQRLSKYRRRLATSAHSESFHGSRELLFSDLTHDARQLALAAQHRHRHGAALTKPRDHHPVGGDALGGLCCNE